MTSTWKGGGRLLEAQEVASVRVGIECEGGSQSPTAGGTTLSLVLVIAVAAALRDRKGRGLDDAG